MCAGIPELPGIARNDPALGGTGSSDGVRVRVVKSVEKKSITTKVDRGRD